jgi:GNAT superfamily N-acetyltransferase
MRIRAARADELEKLGELAFRSKAHWGYDDAFMAACRGEFLFAPAELRTTEVAVAEIDGAPAGLAQLEVDGDASELLKLFIEPDRIGTGVGRALFAWAVARAQAGGASAMRIESDPFAEPFYLKMGARRTGTAPSASIPGRKLPLLSYDLG